MQVAPWNMALASSLPELQDGPGPHQPGCSAPPLDGPQLDETDHPASRLSFLGSLTAVLRLQDWPPVWFAGLRSDPGF